MKVDLILKNEVCEQYKVYPTNNPELFIILENNRSLIRERYKLKKRRIDFKRDIGIVAIRKAPQFPGQEKKIRNSVPLYLM